MALSIKATPYDFSFDPRHTAVVAIDFQKDFLLKGGFGDIQAGGLDEESFQPTIRNSARLFEACRNAGIRIIHTREGHSPDLSDLPFSKVERQRAAPNSRHTLVIGDEGPATSSRLLVRGEHFHDLVDELQPHPGELVIDKPGKGAFFATGLDAFLHDAQITHLLVIGVTTECCVTTTVREANDRGYECCVVSDCTAGFVDQWKGLCLDMVCFSEGLFGFVTPTAQEVIDRLSATTSKFDDPDDTWDHNLTDIRQISNRIRQGSLTARDVVMHSFKLSKEHSKRYPHTFIELVEEKELVRALQNLESRFADKGRLPPLYGIPFAVKDNIDVQGMPTTAACPKFAYKAERSAVAVEKLFEAGAILIGKANLDQFASGLMGTRSGFGNPSNVYSDDHISGGSSSGSAIAVGLRLVCFSIGTDTAASGRVPAFLNGVVGLKPTVGSVSTRGVVPAAPNYDCVTVMAGDCDSASKVWLAMRGHDAQDPYSKPESDGERLCTRFAGRFVGRAMGSRRFTFAVPPESAMAICDPPIRDLFERTVRQLCGGGGTQVQDFDWSPYEEAAAMLYGSALVAERIAALESFMEEKRILLSDEDWHPITRRVVKENREAKLTSSTQVYREEAKLRRLRKRASEAWRRSCKGEKYESPIDFLLTPTVPFHPTLAEAERDPIGLNTRIGCFAQAVNLLDLCAISVPVCEYQDASFTSGRAPFGVQLIGAAWEDGFLTFMGQKIQKGGHSGARGLASLPLR
ncbi:amidase signature enzyme [Violaceomyces palustris]|uniref:Amidase signature enzyme n=1 Tax=Violaceomyces palustris TaxID=1673888 RepID=A0ACD0NZZ1_9BASI|nr:amidase signature enzyme [Violaceomyces palustris]